MPTAPANSLALRFRPILSDSPWLSSSAQYCLVRFWSTVTLTSVERAAGLQHAFTAR